MTFSGEKRILDTDPTISMSVDIKDLLRPSEVVDIDYPALREVLSELGAPKDNSQSSIHYQAKLSGNVSGHHRSATQETQVKFSKNYRTSQTALLHELAHYADFLSNPETKKDSKRNSIGQKALQALSYTVPSSSILFTAVIVTNTRPEIERSVVPTAIDEATYDTITRALELGLVGSSIVSLGACALVAGFYLANKRERIARKGSRKKLPRVLSIAS